MQKSGGQLPMGQFLLHHSIIPGIVSWLPGTGT
jgi:hypothetical protein